jgi:7-carboxy-7-deazaguanine synthase
MSRARAVHWVDLDKTLAVAECYGPTFQGEGPSAGRPALVLRLSRCNLACPSCDVPYTWDWARFSPAAESRRFSASELAKWV